MDALLSSPYALPAAAALVVLLSSLGAYRLVRVRRDDLPETSFQASRYEGPSLGAGAGESFLGSQPTGLHDPRSAGLDGQALSELGALSDVDPVAEADVYLAYGRDRQAEEILREAMSATPQRLDVRIKLLEVLALRREAVPFEALAREVHEATQGQGAPWAQVASMGRAMDPDNPLYANTLPDFEAASQGLDDINPPAPGVPEPAAAMSLELPIEDGAPDAGPSMAPSGFAAALADAEAALGPPPTSVEAADFSLDLGPATSEAPALPAQALPDLATDGPQAEPAAELAELDPGAVDLTADDALEPLAPEDLSPEDPLQRKLALADEFLQIGDMDGARDLLDEVLAQGDGPLKDRARELLESLG